MPVILMKHKFLLMMIFLFLLLSIICQIITGVIFRNLIREAQYVCHGKQAAETVQAEVFKLL